MKVFIFRNSTIENLFPALDYTYSGYGDIQIPNENFDKYFWFYTMPFKINQQELTAEIADYSRKLKLVLSQIEGVLVYCFTLHLNRNIIKWVNNNYELENYVNTYNNDLFQLSKGNSLIKVIDMSEFLSAFKLSEYFDWRFFYTSETIISPRISNQFSRWFQKKEDAIAQKRKKCLVLDLDNTMWGGVLGEDGVEGIALGDTYPGNVFLDFQRCVIEASKNGVILAVCSKNNEEDVIEVWNKHPFMQIGESVISSYRINWNDKASNIKEIAEELNIGLDSFVFIDDNPIERERVKQFLPEVEVPEFPKKIFEIIPFFQAVYTKYFQIYSLTSEDKVKTQQYADNIKRKKYEKNFSDIEEYYKSLDMDLTVYINNLILLTRQSQMTQKTNQFNLTTKRYSEEDIKELMQKGYVVSVEVKDKFGNNGITVLAILKIIDTEIIEFDSFLLSCRILGRDIETAIVSYLYNFLKSRGFKIIRAEYIETKKNQKLTSNFWDKCGFEEVECNDNGHKKYKIDITNQRNIKEYYKFNLA